MRSNSGIVGPKTAPTATNSTGVHDSFDQYNARLDNKWVRVPVVNYTATSGYTAQEGSTVTFSVTVEGVEYETAALFYTVKNGTSTNSDFVSGQLSGSLTFTNGVATRTVNIALDTDYTEVDRTFQIEIRTVSTTGTVIFTSDNYTIPAASMTLTAPSSLNENGTLNFTVATTGLPTKTWQVVCSDPSNTINIWNPTSRSLSVPSNSSASSSFVLRPDFNTNGTRTGSISVIDPLTSIVHRSATFTINDTSTSPTFSASTSSVNEGSSVTFSATIPNSSGYTFNWYLDSSNITSGRFTDNASSGSFSGSSSTITITRTLNENPTFNDGGSFRLRIENQNGTTIAYTPYVTVVDTSPSIIDNYPNGIWTSSQSVPPNVNEGSSITLNFNGGNLSGKTFGYTIGGNVSAADFTTNSLSGTFTAASGQSAGLQTASLTLSLAADLSFPNVDLNESFYVLVTYNGLQIADSRLFWNANFNPTAVIGNIRVNNTSINEDVVLLEYPWEIDTMQYVGGYGNTSFSSWAGYTSSANQYIERIGTSNDNALVAIGGNNFWDNNQIYSITPNAGTFNFQTSVRWGSYGNERFKFSADGSRIIRYNGSTLSIYTLTTPWTFNIDSSSTWSDLRSFNINLSGTGDIDIDPTGTIITISYYTSTVQFAKIVLSTPWRPDLGRTTSTGISRNDSWNLSREHQVTQFEFGADGTTITLLKTRDNNGNTLFDRLVTYGVNTAWDIATVDWAGSTYTPVEKSLGNTSTSDSYNPDIILAFSFDKIERNCIWVLIANNSSSMRIGKWSTDPEVWGIPDLNQPQLDVTTLSPQTALSVNSNYNPANGATRFNYALWDSDSTRTNTYYLYVRPANTTSWIRFQAGPGSISQTTAFTTSNLNSSMTHFAVLNTPGVPNHGAGIYFVRRDTSFNARIRVNSMVTPVYQNFGNNIVPSNPSTDPEFNSSTATTLTLSLDTSGSLTEIIKVEAINRWFIVSYRGYSNSLGREVILIDFFFNPAFFGGDIRVDTIGVQNRTPNFTITRNAQSGSVFNELGLFQFNKLGTEFTVLSKARGSFLGSQGITAGQNTLVTYAVPTQFMPTTNISVVQDIDTTLTVVRQKAVGQPTGLSFTTGWTIEDFFFDTDQKARAWIIWRNGSASSNTRALQTNTVAPEVIDDSQRNPVNTTLLKVTGFVNGNDNSSFSVSFDTNDHAEQFLLFAKRFGTIPSSGPIQTRLIIYFNGFNYSLYFGNGSGASPNSWSRTANVVSFFQSNAVSITVSDDTYRFNTVGGDIGTTLVTEIELVQNNTQVNVRTNAAFGAAFDDSDCGILDMQLQKPNQLVESIDTDVNRCGFSGTNGSAFSAVFENPLTVQQNSPFSSNFINFKLTDGNPITLVPAAALSFAYFPLTNTDVSVTDNFSYITLNGNSSVITELLKYFPTSQFSTAKPSRVVFVSGPPWNPQRYSLNSPYVETMFNSSNSFRLYSGIGSNTSYVGNANPSTPILVIENDSTTVPFFNGVDTINVSEQSSPYIPFLGTVPGGVKPLIRVEQGSDWWLSNPNQTFTFSSVSSIASFGGSSGSITGNVTRQFSGNINRSTITPTKAVAGQFVELSFNLSQVDIYFNNSDSYLYFNSSSDADTFEANNWPMSASSPITWTVKQNGNTVGTISANWSRQNSTSFVFKSWASGGVASPNNYTLYSFNGPITISTTVFEPAPIATASITSFFYNPYSPWWNPSTITVYFPDFTSYNTILQNATSDQRVTISGYHTYFGENYDFRFNTFSSPSNYDSGSLWIQWSNFTITTSSPAGSVTNTISLRSL